jgi:hypothetical protein
MFRFRFRLITLLAVMTLIALSAGVFGIYHRAALAKAEAAKVEDRAYRKISQKGGWVVVETNASFISFYKGPARPMLGCGTGVERTYPPIGSSLNFTDQDLDLFDDACRLCIINFTNTHVTPAGIERFKLRHPTWRIEN